MVVVTEEIFSISNLVEIYSLSSISFFLNSRTRLFNCNLSSISKGFFLLIIFFLIKILYFKKINIKITDVSLKVDNKSANVTFAYDFPPYSFLAKEIIPKFKPCIDEYLEAVSILKDYKFLIYDLKVKKIPICGGFHSWHFENGSIPYSQRKFVLQLYSNDNFEGGETEFLYQNRREIAKQGDVLIFPAGYTHTHRGNPPIGGSKYLITSWALVQDND